MLDFLFAFIEVQDFVAKEKEKRFLRDNPPVVISQNVNSEDNVIESDNAKTENA
ncbi:MAG: hypothetical protein K2N26_00790 [Oscillospiraceae bacterium]|nr:hypothetical protein [Oscillospiraceae bacterium]